MYIKYFNEVAYPGIREATGVSIRSRKLRRARNEDEVNTEAVAELYDTARGNAFSADYDTARLARFSSYDAAGRVLEQLGEALAEGRWYFDLTAYDENGELKSDG